MDISGDQLYKIRKVYGLSREEIGALIGVSGRFISFIEKDERLFPTTRRDMLVSELELTVSKLARINEIYEEGQAIGESTKTRRGNKWR